MIFYKCLKDKAINIEINQYSYLSPKNNNTQKETILDANTRMVSLLFLPINFSIIQEKYNTRKSPCKRINHIYKYNIMEHHIQSC